MATEKAINAGVDIDMMSHYFDAELPGLVKSGRVPMSVVDDAVRRVLRVKFALGLFDHPFTEGPEVTGQSPSIAHLPAGRRRNPSSCCRTTLCPRSHSCRWTRLSRGSPSSAPLPRMPAIWSAPGLGLTISVMCEPCAPPWRNEPSRAVRSLRLPGNRDLRRFGLRLCRSGCRGEQL